MIDTKKVRHAVATGAFARNNFSAFLSDPPGPLPYVIRSRDDAIAAMCTEIDAVREERDTAVARADTLQLKLENSQIPIGDMSPA